MTNPPTMTDQQRLSALKSSLKIAEERLATERDSYIRDMCIKRDIIHLTARIKELETEINHA